MLRTLLIQNPVHIKQFALQKPKSFCTRPSYWLYMRNQHKRELFFGNKNVLHSANFFQATIQAAGFLRVLPKSSFKKLVLSTGLWQYTKMSTTLKATGRLKSSEFKKGQLSNQPPIPYIAERDIVTSKEEPQILKVKLLDDTYLNMPIFSHGNTEEYLAHIVAVLHIIKQKGLGAKCRKLGKAVVKQLEALKNLLEATGSKDTVSSDVDVEACRMEIEQTQQMLQESQKVHDKAIAKAYEQLRNLLSGDL
jgi:hypothetical protein